jgi:hypothetical protein
MKNMEPRKAPQAIAAWRGWGPVIILPVAVLVFTPASWPRWVFMWLLAFVILVGCKWLTWRRTLAPRAQWWQHAGYLLAWPGLNAKSFLSSERLHENDRPALGEWGFAAIKLLVGGALFWGVAGWISEDQRIFSGWVGMVGLILMLHFGAFHLLSCAWRSAGIDARPIMNRPLASVSVSEFWGRRWNTAFRDFTHRFLFRPLNSWLGPRPAILAGFVFSGIIQFNARELANGSGLARGMCGYIGVFWGVRLALQWVFDVKDHISTWWLRLGYYILTILFASFTLLYGFAALRPFE